MNGITDEMIVAGADVIDPTHAFASTKRTVREVLEAALAGRTVVDLPQPDAGTARALVEYWNGDPATLPQEERFALQKLADVREARRLAAESSEGGDPR